MTSSSLRALGDAIVGNVTAADVLFGESNPGPREHRPRVERESGMAIVRKPVQVLRVEPTERMMGSLLALYNDGTLYEMVDGLNVWNEVRMP